jgi:hypothetical protein
MARGEKTDRGRRPASKRSPARRERPRGRSAGHGSGGAAEIGRAAAETKSNRAESSAGPERRPAARRGKTAPAGGRSAKRGRVRGAPASSAGQPVEDSIDLAEDAATAGFLPPDLEEEMEAGERESLERPPSEFAAGRRQRRDELETDGPVIGGPGMRRMGDDRAISSGTGGLAAGEDLDPVAEGDYWRENFRRSPYSAAETEERYEPAYRFGWARAGQYEYRNRGFEEVEIELQRDWESEGEEQPWEDAREAARDAWERARRRD